MRAEYVYIASSWKNTFQPAVISVIENAGIDCYDFKHPEPLNDGFHWSNVLGKDYKPSIPYRTYITALGNSAAEEGFQRDFQAMQKASHFILVLPCGKSAHLELGWAVGAGKKTCILTEELVEPELMYNMVDVIFKDILDVLWWLGVQD